MTKAVHIEGMGVPGAILAWRLHEHGIPFTWHDTEEAVCAWRASTGCIYPSGNPFDMKNYLRWADWHREPPWPRDWQLTEAAAYWYSSKSAPHGGGVQPLIDIGPLRLHPQPSYHLNAQALVERTREAFHDLRTRLSQVPEPASCTYLVAHGFSPERMDHYLWGWSAPVRLAIDPRLDWADQRPSLYLRRLRFVFGYAYPKPGTNEWYAGSSLIVQARGRTHPLDVQAKLQKWTDLVHEHTEGLVRVTDVGEPVQGWRPAPTTTDDMRAPLVELHGHRHVMRPLRHSGVRWSPLATDALLGVVRPGLARPDDQITMRPIVSHEADQEVRPATPEDQDWIAALWKPNEHILGPFGVTWHRYWWNNRSPAEHWAVIPLRGFAHYRVRRDGSVTLYEIAVAAKRQGVGSRLLAHISDGGARPVQLKTDADHAESNAFYLAAGFTQTGSRTTKNGRKTLNEYRR